MTKIVKIVDPIRNESDPIALSCCPETVFFEAARRNLGSSLSSRDPCGRFLPPPTPPTPQPPPNLPLEIP